jgi:hypothetical protein
MENDDIAQCYKHFGLEDEQVDYKGPRSLQGHVAHLLLEHDRSQDDIWLILGRCPCHAGWWIFAAKPAEGRDEAPGWQCLATDATFKRGQTDC